MEEALAGIKVIDLTWHIAGPYCTKVLASLGADVIKIEKIGDGDPSRRVGPFPDNIPHLEKSGLFLYLNTGKKSITLNLKSEFGKTTIKELVKSADIIVENFSPRVMPSLGLEYQVLGNIYPRLVMTSITNFGQSGPYRDFKADENILHAMGGLTFTTGDEYLPPVKQGGSQAQYLGGLHAFAATMIAFHCQQIAGVGQHVDQSIMEAWNCHLEFPGWSYTGRIRHRTGNLLNILVGLYPTKDGYCGIGGGGDWLSLKKAIKIPELDDPKFDDAAGRDANADELRAFLLSWTTERTKREMYDTLQAAGAPAGMVTTPGELLDDSQLKFRRFFTELDHPAASKLIYPTIGVHFSETPCLIKRAPLLGEHNEEIYRELGYDKKDLVRLRQLGLI